MRNQLTSVAGVLLVSLVLGCGPSMTPHEKLVNDMSAHMERIGSTLATVKDKKSALAARDKLESMVSAFNQSMEKGKQLGDPPQEIREKLEVKMKDTQQIFQGQVGEFMRQAMNDPQILEAIGPVLDKLGK